MGNFDRAFTIVVGVEGGLSLDPTDPGNWTGGKQGVGVLKGTKYGISAAQYPNVDIPNLTLDGAKAIYQSDYWNAVQGDALPWPLGLYVFDASVNQGQGTARMMMQTALGVQSDGVLGPITLAAAHNSTDYHAAYFMTVRTFQYQRAANYALNAKGWMNRLFTVAANQNQGA
jgi:lysozyme family protein